jgi:phage terminase small subunit
MPKGLNAKQQAFVEAYLTCWNETEAARRAGYANPNNNAHRLMVNDGIQAAIQARLVELKMSADEVLTRLAEHARGSLADFLRITGDGDLRGFDLSEDKPLHLLKKASISKRTYKDTTEETVTIELYDAQAALNLLGKHHKLFTDVTEHTGEIGYKVYKATDEFDPDSA